MNHKIILADNDIERIVDYLDAGIGDIDDILMEITTQAQIVENMPKLLVAGKYTHYAKKPGVNITLCGICNVGIPVTKLKVTCKECLRLMDLELLNAELVKKNPKKSEETKHIKRLKDTPLKRLENTSPIPFRYQYISSEFRILREKVTELVEVVNQLTERDENRKFFP